MNSIVSYCKKFGLIILSLLFLFSGCASPKKLLDLEQEINQLKITVEVLEKSNVEMNMKLDSLTDSVKMMIKSIYQNQNPRIFPKQNPEKSPLFRIFQTLMPISFIITLLHTIRLV